MLSLNIESDSEYGCWVYLTTWFGSFHYYSHYDIEKELVLISQAINYQGNDFKEHFIKTLELKDVIDKINIVEE